MKSKELVIREEDNIVEYKNVPEKSTELQEKKSKIPGERSINLYKALLQREEFRRPETKEQVLDEDEYLDYLEEIIQRDYYPELYKKKDRRQTLQNRQDNLEKPNSDDVKDPNNSTNSIPNIDSMNVDEYMWKYSSDELESLKDIILKDKERKLRKFFWMYKQENDANEKLCQLKEYQKEYLALPNEPNKHFEQSDIGYTENDAKNSLFFNPVYSRAVLIAHKRKRAETSNNENENDDDSNQEEKEVIKENTRLPENFIDSMMHTQNQRVKRKLFETYENSDVVKLLKEIKDLDAKLKEESQQAAKTPMIRGYKLIKEPDPKPGVIDPLPIFTWGEIASTPNIIGQQSSKFSVPQTPVRETIAHDLVNKMNKKTIDEAAERAMQTNNLKTVRSSTKSYDFTPSAMKLLDSVKRSQNLKSSNIFDNNSTGKTPCQLPGGKNMISTIRIKRNSNI